MMQPDNSYAPFVANPDSIMPQQSSEETTGPAASSNSKRSSVGQEWCDVLERFGLDPEQAEALTRATVQKAEAWHQRWAEFTPHNELTNEIVDRPTHPDALRRGLELWRRRKGLDV